MDKKLVVLIALFFLSFAFFVGILIFREPLSRFTRAKEDLIPSSVNSKILAWPFRSVVADGVSESVVSVFVISESSRPLVNKVVTLTTTLGNIRKTSATTDNYGKATFRISSDTPGIAEVEASVEPDIKIAQKVSINFE